MYEASFGTNSRTVLFIEDDPIVLRVYGDRLKQEGYEIRTAENGSAAIEMLPQVRPDLVVLDLMLPKVSGLEVLKFIRADAQLKDTPVVVLSNVFMSELAHKALEAGANKGMLKTECTPAKLVEIIRSLLEKTPENESKPAGNSPAEHNGVAAPASPCEDDTPQKIRAELLRDAPMEIAKLREYCVAYIKGIGSEANVETLGELFRRVRQLNAKAGLSRCTKISQLASALEAVIFEIVFKASASTSSTLNTIAQAVDHLGRLFQNGDTGSTEAAVKAKVLVVDDDAVCNYVTVAALKRANFDAVCTQDPKAALKMMEAGRFDLVLLDINMPGMNGFEVCESLRRLPEYKTVPVIFVTIQNDFQSRARSVASGGDNFISKPISPLELALKATMLLLKSQEPRPAALPAKVNAPTEEPPRAPLTETIEIRTVGIGSAPSPDGVSAINAPPAALPDATVHPSLSTPATTSLDNQPLDTEEAGKSRLEQSTTELRTDISSRETAQPVHLPQTVPLQSEVLIPAPAAGFFTKGRDNRFETTKTEDALRIKTSSGNNNLHAPMKKKNESNQPFEQVALAVARTLFGDEQFTDLNLRLVHIALEHYGVLEIMNGSPRPGTEGPGSDEHKTPFEQIAFEAARVAFGDDQLSDLNVRLVRTALQHYKVPDICRTACGGEYAGQREAVGPGTGREDNPMTSDGNRFEQKSPADVCAPIQEVGSRA